MAGKPPPHNPNFPQGDYPPAYETLINTPAYIKTTTTGSTTYVHPVPPQSNTYIHPVPPPPNTYIHAVPTPPNTYIHQQTATVITNPQQTYGSIPVVIQPRTTDVIFVGGCPACRVGVLNEDFTLAGLCCAFLFFPLGILCCLAMREKKCSNCGAVFS